VPDAPAIAWEYTGRDWRPLTWRIYGNSVHEPRLIASGAGTETLAVDDTDLWRRIRVEVSDEG